MPLLPAAIFAFFPCSSSAAEPGARRDRFRCKDRPLPLRLPNPVAAQSLEQLSTIVDRPLFSPSRRPPAPAARTLRPIVPGCRAAGHHHLHRPTLVLFGVVMDGESARRGPFVVRARTRKWWRAQIGDEIGWMEGQPNRKDARWVLSLDGRFAHLHALQR